MIYLVFRILQTVSFLRTEKHGCSLIKNPKNKIIHLLYMDDHKLYEKNIKEVKSLVETVRMITEYVRMRFGLQKCAKLAIKRGKKEDDVGIVLPDNGMMKDF